MVINIEIVPIVGTKRSYSTTLRSSRDVQYDTIIQSNSKLYILSAPRRAPRRRDSSMHVKIRIRRNIHWYSGTSTPIIEYMWHLYVG
jgi:hypothetical protein